MLTVTDGVGKQGIIMVRVFSLGGRHGGMGDGGIASLSHTLATAAAATCSLSFRWLWA